MNVGGDGYSVLQPFVTNLSAVETKLLFCVMKFLNQNIVQS